MIGIIGGTIFSDSEFFEKIEQRKINTPYGPPSSELVFGVLGSKKVVFLARHGNEHTIPPHKINYRANIWALFSVGVGRVVSFSAVGSLKEEIKPGDFVIPDNFFDWTKSRKNTFYDGPKVGHIEIAEPFCPDLRAQIINSCKKLDIPYHANGTCICIDGPRFSTRAESNIFRKWGLDIINMTLVPEVVLAREKGMCYANIGMVTDYDVWKEEKVSLDNIRDVIKSNENNIKLLLKHVLSNLGQKTCSCEKVLENAFI